MPKFEQIAFGYDDPEAYAQSVAQLRPLLDYQFRLTLTDEDCSAIAELLAICEGEWRSVCEAADKELVLNHLAKVALHLDELRELLSPEPPLEEPSKRQIAARDAVWRLRTLASEHILQEGGRRDGLSHFVATLRYLQRFTAEAQKEAEVGPTSGERTAHLNRLLTGLKPILKKHDRPTSYTTDRAGKRSSVLADFAMEVGRLLPRGARPASEGALADRLADLQSIRKREEAGVVGVSSG